jgi:hypothetical protein
MAFPVDRWRRQWPGMAPPVGIQRALQAARSRRSRLTATIDYLERLIGATPEATAGTLPWSPAPRRVRRIRAAVQRLKFQRSLLSTWITELEGRAPAAGAAFQPDVRAGAARAVADYDQ